MQYSFEAHTRTRLPPGMLTSPRSVILGVPVNIRIAGVHCASAAFETGRSCCEDHCTLLRYDMPARACRHFGLTACRTHDGRGQTAAALCLLLHGCVTELQHVSNDRIEYITDVLESSNMIDHGVGAAASYNAPRQRCVACMFPCRTWSRPCYEGHRGQQAPAGSRTCGHNRVGRRAGEAHPRIPAGTLFAAQQSARLRLETGAAGTECAIVVLCWMLAIGNLTVSLRA